MIPANVVLRAMEALPLGALADIMGDRPVLVMAPHADDESLGCGGLIAAFWLDISPGGAVVLTQGLAFGLAVLFGPRRGLVNRWARGRSTRAGRHAVDSG